MTVKKAFRIYKVFVIQELKRIFEYRADFFMGISSFMIGQLFVIVFLEIIFENITSLQGWSFEEILFLYGFYLIPKGIDHLMFDNLWSVSNYMIKNGDFDKYLLRPLNTLFYVTIEKLQMAALGELIIGVALIYISLQSIEIEWSITKILLMVLSALFATFIYTGIKIIAASFAFWIKISGNVMYTLYMVNDFAKYPISIYNDFVNTTITYIIPFAFTAFFPVTYILTGENPGYNIGLTIAFSILIMMIGIFLWKKGVRFYESSGN